MNRSRTSWTSTRRLSFSHRGHARQGRAVSAVAVIHTPQPPRLCSTKPSPEWSCAATPLTPSGVQTSNIPDTQWRARYRKPRLCCKHTQATEALNELAKPVVMPCLCCNTTTQRQKRHCCVPAVVTQRHSDRSAIAACPLLLNTWPAAVRKAPALPSCWDSRRCHLRQWPSRPRCRVSEVYTCTGFRCTGSPSGRPRRSLGGGRWST